MNRVVLRLSFLALCTACAPVFLPGEPTTTDAPSQAGRTQSSPAPPPYDATAFAELRDAILDEVNATRRAHGVGALSNDASLAVAAVDYAAELARKRRLSHESETPGRGTLAERLAAAGMTDWSLIGENLAMTTEFAPDVAEAVIALWLDSPGHRRNLLHPDFTLSGIGAARTGDGRWYVAQVYARPMAGGR